jgi:hypothetical protein
MSQVSLPRGSRSCREMFVCSPKKVGTIHARMIPCYAMLQCYHIHLTREISWLSPPKVDHLLYKGGLSENLDEFVSHEPKTNVKSLLTAPTKSIENTLSSV